MKNVFLDLGTHFGQGLHHFRHHFNMNEDWIIHTFEANPHAYQFYIKERHCEVPWAIAHNVAVGDKDGEVEIIILPEFYDLNSKCGQASSVSKNWNPWEMREKGLVNVETVRSIDFSKFIQDNFSKEDNIIVKMDIEGSEFVVIKKMIEDDTISFVNHIIIEWHSNYFENKEEMKNLENKLKEKLKINSSIIVEDWH